MKISNGRLLELNAVLNEISNSTGGAKLKYAANLNRTIIQPFIDKIAEVRSAPVEGSEEWTAFKNEMILAECLKGPSGEPILIQGSYQFEDQSSFVAKLDRLRLEKFGHLIELEVKLQKEFEDLLREEVSISDFPYAVKWDFIRLDENGEMKGLTGHQQFVLMATGLLKGEPPWLTESSESNPT
jgi:hypothetical protein